MVRRLKETFIDQATGVSRTMSEGVLHGGRLLEARRHFPQAPAPFIDLSTGINPRSYPIPRFDAAAWTRLPQPEEIAALQQESARAYRAAGPGLVVPVPGTQILISLLPRLFGDRQAAILSPTYGEYARSFAAHGGDVLEARDLVGLQAAPCAILCNPNNPDGRRFPASELLALLEARDGGLLVVDESFADLEDPDFSLIPHLPHPGLLILRSLSKCYGLGGLRLGFALANAELAAMIREALGPWPVSGPAIAIGRRALGDTRWLAETKEQLAGDGARLDALLAQVGLRKVGGTLLFRLAESPEAQAMYQRLGEAGILVRRFTHNPRWLRFGFPGDEAAWKRLETALG